jgi:hypothetical protein
MNKKKVSHEIFRCLGKCTTSYQIINDMKFNCNDFYFWTNATWLLKASRNPTINHYNLLWSTRLSSWNFLKALCDLLFREFTDFFFHGRKSGNYCGIICFCAASFCCFVWLMVGVRQKRILRGGNLRIFQKSFVKLCGTFENFIWFFRET